MSTHSDFYYRSAAVRGNEIGKELWLLSDSVLPRLLGEHHACPSALVNVNPTLQPQSCSSAAAPYAMDSRASILGESRAQVCATKAAAYVHAPRRVLSWVAWGAPRVHLP